MATTTPNYGWDVPTSSDYVKQGAVAIETLGDDIDATLWTALGGNYPGLRLVKKQTVGTGVASVTVTNAFSATYVNYKILYTEGVKSNDDQIRFRLGASTTGYYSHLIYGNFGTNAPFGATDNNSANWNWVGGGDSNGCWLATEMLGPFTTKYTRMIGGAYGGTTSTGYLSGVHKVATSYTDFTLIPESGTLTGGTIYVYGYGAS